VAEQLPCSLCTQVPITNMTLRTVIVSHRIAVHGRDLLPTIKVNPPYSALFISAIFSSHDICQVI
jgi:hypothetical protein